MGTTRFEVGDLIRYTEEGACGWEECRLLRGEVLARRTRDNGVRQILVRWFHPIYYYNPQWEKAQYYMKLTPLEALATAAE